MDETITESAIITQFLADVYLSHLLPPNNGSPTAPLFRVQVNFAVDTWFSKGYPLWMGIAKEANAAERQKKGDELVEKVEKETEPLLKEAGLGPFFGGKRELTLVEVCCIFSFSSGSRFVSSSAYCLLLSAYPAGPL